MKTERSKILTNLLVSQIVLAIGLFLHTSQAIHPSVTYAQEDCPECGGMPSPECTGNPGDWYCCGGTWINLDYQCCCSGVPTMQ